KKKMFSEITNSIDVVKKCVYKKTPSIRTS
ncbi:MAG: hypothetical protein ACI8YP_003473, partial [Algoriphagus sp.]